MTISILQKLSQFCCCYRKARAFQQPVADSKPSPIGKALESHEDTAYVYHRKGITCGSPSSHVDHNLICELSEISKKNGKARSVYSTTYEVPIKSNGEVGKSAVVQVQSWKMREWDYYKVPPPFPTLARGLFTTYDEEDGGTFRIVARGYDKFFNLSEVPWTAWDPLKEHTCPPYVMTLKSNGCIIFIAALTSSKLIVTSKHALGELQGGTMSHSQMGEKWLYQHLERKGKTAEQLAQVLWDKKWTAVAELCDDSFEEHVLPYNKEKTGLHLHGLNRSSGEFKSEPSEDVATFAREWGFIETPFHSLSSIDEVREFTSTVAEQGQWNGEPIEGFVVRCHVKNGYSPNDRDSPPYPPGSSFFFKVKYDEPYLMYRDWREITRILLDCKEGEQEQVNIPRSKLRRPKSRLYLEWVKGDIERNPGLFTGFDEGRGIIAARERFLQYCRDRKDQSDVKALADLAKDDKEFGKTIIMPIAVPGCGKTTISVALSALFGFGHIQSDNVPGKPPQFLKRVVEELKNRNVVIADKINILKQHRSGLRKAVKDIEPPVRLLALNWDLDISPAMTHRICADRIISRGDNHQTLLADLEGKQHEKVLWGLLRQMEPLEDSEADEVVDMDVTEDIEQSFGRAVEACVRIIGYQKPEQEEIDRALAVARGYTAPKGKGQKKNKVPRYYGILPEIDLQKLLGPRLSGESVPPQLKEFWDSLCDSKRVSKIPHITIVHSNGLPGVQQLWDLCCQIDTGHESSMSMFSVKLGHVICNDRVMAICIDDLEAAMDSETSANEDAKHFARVVTEDPSVVLHVTVGTHSPDINPYEAHALVDSWRNGSKEGIHDIPMDDIFAKGRLNGLYN